MPVFGNDQECRESKNPEHRLNQIKDLQMRKRTDRGVILPACSERLCRPRTQNSRAERSLLVQRGRVLTIGKSSEEFARKFLSIECTAKLEHSARHERTQKKSGQRRPATRCRSGRAFATRRHPPVHSPKTQGSGSAGCFGTWSADARKPPNLGEQSFRFRERTGAPELS